MSIQWCVIGFGIRHIFSVGQIKGYIKKVNTFLVSFNGNFHNYFNYFLNSLNYFDLAWGFVAYTKSVISV